MHVIQVNQKRGLNYGFINGEKWNARGDRRDIGDFIINILFYCNKDNRPIQVLVNGVDETADFQQQAIDEYKGTGLNHLLNYIGKQI